MTREWAERLPKSVRVGPFDLKLELWPVPAARASQRFGECSLDEQVIRIQEEMPSMVKLVEVVFHELTHAIYRISHIDEADGEERIACLMGVGWTQIYRDNPDLVAWLSEASAEMRA